MAFFNLPPNQNECRYLFQRRFVVDGFTQKDVSYTQFPTDVGQLGTASRLSGPVARYYDPIAFGTEPGKPFIVRITGAENVAEVIESRRTVEQFLQSNHRRLADAFVEQEFGRIAHAAAFPK